MTAETTPKTLFVVNLDFPKDAEDESNRWFDRDHVPERVACAGFHWAQRFQRTDIQPAGYPEAKRWTKYVNVYEIDDLDVMISDAYLSIMKAAPANAWTKRRRDRAAAAGLPVPVTSIPNGIPTRSFWTQRPVTFARSGRVTLPPPRTLLMVFSDIDQAHAAEVNAYLDEEAIPDTLSCTGVLRCERYEKVIEPGKPASDSATQPQYMDLYDVETPEVLTTDEFRAIQRSPSDRGKRLAPHITVKGSAVYLQRPSPWLVSL